MPAFEAVEVMRCTRAQSVLDAENFFLIAKINLGKILIKQSIIFTTIQTI